MQFFAPHLRTGDVSITAVIFPMKKLLYILGGLFVVAIIGAVIVILSLGSIVKAGINNFGPKITQTTVVLQDARISPFSGSGTLKGLTVGNPTGWQTPQAFYLKEITIALEKESLKGDHIIIDQLVVDQPEITYETKITTSNLQDLLNNIQQAAGSSTEPVSQPAPTTKEGKPVKIEIKSFRFQNGTIHLSGAGKTMSVPMPDIVLENLGTPEGGLTPNQLSLVIMKEITSQALKAGVNAATKNSLIDKASEGLRGLLGGKK
jgi:hypothetical protein